jgi:hypothetical protein
LKHRLLLGCLLAWLLPAPALAQVARFAVVIGHNEGARGEQRLRYAESDAARVQQTLLDLGRVPAENALLLSHRSGPEVRRAIININERIRRAVADGAQQAMLLVYYSGHGDAAALHLADSQLDLQELRDLVSGSAAQVRLLVVDACRSGALTRLKGGRPVAPFAISLEEQLAGEGAVVLTSSAANEDSQESDALGGSFFTQYFVSALLGAADDNRDDVVSLAEAYRYAYDNTLRASSRTLAGSQHPTFQYQVRGHGEIPLTFLRDAFAARAQLVFPAGQSYLLLRDQDAGAVVAEVVAQQRPAQLSLEPGRYFVRGRGPDYLLEGTIAAPAGQVTQVQPDQLSRIAYARLVRKGASDERASAHALQLGYRLRTPFWRDVEPCQGLFVGYALVLRNLTISPRLGACGSSFDNRHLHANANELDLALHLSHGWDLGPLHAALAVLGGGAYLWEHFETRGRAPDRDALALEIGAGIGLEIALVGRLHALADAALVSYVFREQHGATRSLSAIPVGLFSLGFGLYL